MRLFVKDLKTGDVLVDHPFAIREIAKKVGKRDNEYYSLILSDKTGSVDAKIWSDYFINCDLANAKVGEVVSVTGKVDSFNDSNQVIIEKITKLSKFDPAEFLREGVKDREKLFSEILSVVSELQDDEIKNLILKIFEDKELVEKYKDAPAGELVHHNYVGGLMEHVDEMLQFALTAKKVYPEVRISELVFGVLFHDIGKLEELGTTGVVLERTVPGYLMGHLGQGLLLISKYFPENFDKNKKERLLHFILSHHGEREKGSPIQPMTLEAILLSEIDNLSFKMGAAYEHLRKETLDEKGMTGYSKYLGGSLFSSSTPED